MRQKNHESFRSIKTEHSFHGIHFPPQEKGESVTYVSGTICSIRRECLDHVIVFNEASLRRALRLYFDYYHKSRTHLSLGKDSPEPRPIQSVEMGRIVAVPQVGGLHHRYERRAA